MAGTVSDRSVVLVGGGLAATRTVEALHGLEPTTRVTIVSAEGHLPYDRPPLSKQVLRGEVDAAPLRVEWESLGTTLLLGRRAVALHPVERRVLLDDGMSLSYDDLVIATGATPRTLPGLSGEGVHELRTLEDSVGLAADVRKHGQVVVVGGGFIGCEVAASARALGAEVTIVELLPAPLARALGTEVGEQVAQLHRDAGVDVRCGVSVVESRGEGVDRTLLLSDDSHLQAPVVVVGLGVLPDTGWLTASGVEVDDGIVCDSSGRTSIPRVWAAGDVARWFHPLFDEHVRLEHWTSAVEQGAIVAAGLAGQDAVQDSVPYVWSDQYDKKLQILGRPHADDQVSLLRVGPAADRLLAVYGQGDRVTGVLGMNAAKWVMRLRQQVRDGTSYADALAVARS